jgi:hypothetical protein
MHDAVFDIPLLRTGGHPSAERRALQRRVHRGELVALRPGVLVEPAHLVGLRPEQRHVLLVRASAPGITPPSMISHRSAAAVHGLPFVGDPPDRVDVTDPRRTCNETTALRRVHAPPRAVGADGRWADLAPTTAVHVAGAPVTSLVRTLVDVAASTPLLDALPMLDAALHDRRLLPEMLTDELARARRKGEDKASTALALASARSASPAESVCRVRFLQLRTPEPVQQHSFARAGERTAVVDFWFPEQGVVVEVDGRAKYEDPTMLAGRSTAQAHWQEKHREDFIRSFPEVRTVVRLTWADLMDPERVRAMLTRAGVPCR